MLTAEQRAGLELYLNNADRIGVGTGGWESDPLTGEWWTAIGEGRRLGTSGFSCVGYWGSITEATQEHYDAACGRLGRWLANDGWFVCQMRDGRWLLIHTHQYEATYQSKVIDCPDDELTAMTYAALAVKGEKL